MNLTSHQYTSKARQDNHPNLGAFIDQCLDKVFSMNDFFGLLEAISSEDRLKQHYGIIGFRKLLSDAGGPPIQPVIDANLVPRFANFLEKEDEPRLQLEAAWALTNIASGTSSQIQSLVDTGIIPRLIRLLSCRKQDIAEQAIWALGNIAGDASSLRDLILQYGGLEPLINLVYPSDDEVLVKVGIWAISNLCRGRPLPQYELVKKAVPVLSKVLQEYDDIEILTDASWAISYLSDGSNKIEAIVQTNIIPTLVNLLGTQYLALLIPVLRTIGNILTGNETQTNLVLDVPGAIDKLFHLLDHKKKAVRKEVCWALSSVAAGTQDQIDFILRNPKFLTKLVYILNSDVAEVRKEASWVLVNLSNTPRPDQMSILLEAGLLETFCTLLSSDDPKILELLLQGINNFLAYGVKTKTITQIAEIIEKLGAVKKIEDLQFHSDDEVYLKALNVLETYFDLEEIVE